MKKFILKVLLFLVVIAIVDKAFGFAMANVLRHTNKGDWGRNNFILNDVESDVIILGSSRAIHHYNPLIIADTLGMSCYNCGEDGMGIFLMWARYQAIRKRHNPKLVIYEVLPEYDLLENHDNMKYLKFLRPYCDKSFISSVICDVSSRESVKLWSQMYLYNSVFVEIVQQSMSKSPSTAQEYTYFPLCGQMSYNPKVNEHKDVHFDPLKLAYLKDLIIQSKEDKVRLVFTASPIYRPQSDREYMPLKNLCCEYGVPFINHYCDSVYSENPTFFVDASHLNIRGAELFTTLVVSEIKDTIQKKGNGVQ